jgi:hypothetical protein
MVLSAPFFQKTLHSAWKEISRLRDNVSTKRSRLQLQKQKLKLFAILRGQASDMLLLLFKLFMWLALGFLITDWLCIAYISLPFDMFRCHILRIGLILKSIIQVLYQQQSKL